MELEIYFAKQEDKHQDGWAVYRRKSYTDKYPHCVCYGISKAEAHEMVERLTIYWDVQHHDEAIKEETGMTWKEKFVMLQLLTRNINIAIRNPGSWDVSLANVEIASDGMLKTVVGYGSTPEKAIEDLWDKLTMLPPGHKIVMDAYQDTRREYLWDGLTWARYEA